MLVGVQHEAILAGAHVAAHSVLADVLATTVVVSALVLVCVDRGKRQGSRLLYTVYTRKE